MSSGLPEPGQSFGGPPCCSKQRWSNAPPIYSRTPPWIWSSWVAHRVCRKRQGSPDLVTASSWLVGIRLILAEARPHQSRSPPRLLERTPNSVVTGPICRVLAGSVTPRGGLNPVQCCSSASCPHRIDIFRARGGNKFPNSAFAKWVLFGRSPPPDLGIGPKLADGGKIGTYCGRYCPNLASCGRNSPDFAQHIPSHAEICQISPAWTKFGGPSRQEFGVEILRS